MKKLIALATVTAVATVGTLAATHPDEANQLADRIFATALRAWDGIEANPLPVLVAVGTFILTVAYHKLRGKSLRESVEVAATRVTVVAVPAPAPAEPTVVQRAQARATRTQLLADQIGLETRLRKLPNEVRQAEKETCYTEQALADAEKALELKRKAHEDAVAKLEALRTELAAGETELNAIADELKKLAEVV